MSNHTLSRRTMVVVLAAVVALGATALPAAAKGKGSGKGRGDQTVQTVTSKGKGRSAEAKQRAPKFVVVGFVTTVDTAEVTVRIKGGNKSLRKLGTPVSFTVADDARVKLNGEKVALSALAAGDHVVVKGAKIGDVLTARKVFASRKVEEDKAEETTDATTPTDGTTDATTPTDGTTDATTPTDGTTGGTTPTDGTTDGTTPTDGTTTTP